MTKRKTIDQYFGGHSSQPPRKVSRSSSKVHDPSGSNPDAKPGEARVRPETTHDHDGGNRQSSQHSETDNSKHSKNTHLRVVEKTGDIFAAPPNSVLIHACNCEGHWGAGIAKAFKEHYPEAYDIYHAHCLKSTAAADLPGTALLIPPQHASNENEDEASAGHFVGCLFTSRGKGRTKDSPARILANTGPAMRDLLSQISAWNAMENVERKTEELLICKINSGLFKVPWEKTRAVLEGVEVAEDVTVTVMEQG